MLPKKALLLTLCILALLAIALPALAGGWVTVEPDELSAGELRPGQPIHLGFTVLQHGQTPVHTANIMNDQPLIPVLIAVNQETAEYVTAAARPDAEIGHFTVEFTLPTAGSWEWSIIAPPFEGQSMFEPLTVVALEPAPAAAESQPSAAQEIAPAAPELNAELAPAASEASAAEVLPTTAAEGPAISPLGLALLAALLLVAVLLGVFRRPAPLAKQR